MDKFKGKYRIPSSRLSGWDYTSPGYYFVTICTYNHQTFFGRVIDGQVNLSPLGDIAREFWLEIPTHFHRTCLDEFVIMPNHIHGIVIINANYSASNDITVETQHAASLQYRADPISHPKLNPHKQLNKPAPGSLSAIIRSYKSAVTRWARRNDHPHFAWQPRFYDHIIQDENSLENIRAYIMGNPVKWETDEYHPGNLGSL